MKNYLKMPLISCVFLFAWGLSAMNKLPWIFEVRTAEDVKRLCGGKFDVKKLENNRDKRTILTQASQLGDGDVVAALLDAGVDIEFTDVQGDTALRVATNYGHLNVVKLLIDRKANINAQGFGGNSALHFAARQNAETIVTLLIAAGADLDLKNRSGTTPLQDAYARSQLKEAKVIAAAMAYQGKDFPASQCEEVEIGREIGLAMRDAERTKSEYPQSENAEHKKIIEFIKTLKKPKLRSRI